MNRSLLKRVIAGSVAWTAMALLCGVVALAQDAAPAGGQRTDGQIEMDVVHALDQSAALKNDLITAATIQGQDLPRVRTSNPSPACGPDRSNRHG